MSVLKVLFCSSFNQATKPCDDYELVFEVKKDGSKVTTFRKVDYAKLAEERGTIKNWSLDSLLKAGINPGIFISTYPSTRISGDDNLEVAIHEGMTVIEKSINENEKTE